MVEENKSLSGRLDEDLQSAHRQMALLRAELSDTNKRISQLGSSSSSSTSTPSHGVSDSMGNNSNPHNGSIGDTSPTHVNGIEGK